MCPSFLLGKILFKQNMNFRMSHSILSEYIYCDRNKDGVYGLCSAVQI